MANWGWDDVRVRYGNNADIWYDVHPYIDEETMAGLKADIEDWRPKGSTWLLKRSVGTKSWDGDIEFGGLYDDTATSGPDALFDNDGARLGGLARIAESHDAGATWKIANVIVGKYLPEPKSGALTRYKATFTPYGAPVYTGAAGVSGTVSVPSS